MSIPVKMHINRDTISIESPNYHLSITKPNGILYSSVTNKPLSLGYDKKGMESQMNDPSTERFALFFSV